VDTGSPLLTASYFRRIRDLKGTQTVRTGDDEVADAIVLHPERSVSGLGDLELTWPLRDQIGNRLDEFFDSQRSPSKPNVGPEIAGWLLGLKSS